ncbi:alpha/beta hydrolase [Massilia sp. H-1]|nr:alpha/beta hydrolase [Massilia sp. H-1]
MLGQTPLRGLILSSCHALAVRLSPLQHQMLRVMHALAPRLGVPNGLQPRYLSHDAAVVAAYQSDPLVHGKISAPAALHAGIHRLLPATRRHAQGAAAAAGGRMTTIWSTPTAAAASPAQLPEGRCTFKTYDGFYHEIFNEVDAALPLADLRAWLTAQLT